MKLYNFLLLYFLRQWHPTPVLLPGKSHGWRSLVGCSPCGRWGSGTWLSDFTFTFHFHGEGNGNPLQCSCLENPRGRRAWWAAVYGVTQSRAWLKCRSSSSRFVIAFLSRSKQLLISWLQSPSTVILEPKKIKSVTVSTVSLSICHKVMGLDAMIIVFWMLSFKQTFSFSSFTFIKRLFMSSLLSAIRVVLSAYLRLLIFLPGILIPAQASSNSAFLMMYSAYKLNKQSDNVQPRSPFPVLNQYIVPWMRSYKKFIMIPNLLEMKTW